MNKREVKGGGWRGRGVILPRNPFEWSVEGPVPTVKVPTLPNFQSKSSVVDCVN